MAALKADGVRHLRAFTAVGFLVAGCSRASTRHSQGPGLKQLPSAQAISTGQAFVQNLRRGYYELATHLHPRNRLSATFIEHILGS